MPYAEIAVPAPLYTTFTYSFDKTSPLPLTPSLGGEGEIRKQPLKAGMRVVVPFGKRKTVGICMKVSEHLHKDVDQKKLKAIESIIDERPSVSTSLLKLIEWMSTYYQSPIGEVVRCALPPRLLKLSAPKTTRPVSPHGIPCHNVQKDIVLSDDQSHALQCILAASKKDENKVFLLHGVTGSGKTEVYLSFFEHLTKTGKQGLLLVPEIGLTPQLTERTVARFGKRVAVYHSGLTDAQRHEQWMNIANGKVDVVVGTRSALFAPLPNLGAIIVDEEHDGSYKQDDGFAYNARDAAVMRAHIEGTITILGSATPSLESTANVHAGKYSLLELKTRPTEFALPDVEIVDMRKKRRSHMYEERSDGTKKVREFVILSPELYDAIDETLAKKKQVLLYIGRRGFASSVQCISCGEPIRCPNCDIALTSHVSQKRHARDSLVCHYCDYKISTPDTCSFCNSKEIVPVGFGTERLEAEVMDFFPNARVARLDSDIAESPKARRKVLEDLRRGNIDILVGTQMITKGHDYPAITLVGVVAADMSLAIPDFRSAEKTFQLITQVAGRAGRGDHPGRVIVQTRQPTHYSLLTSASHDYSTFSTKELSHRKEMGYPPFSRLANLRFQSNKKDMAVKSSENAKLLIEKIIVASKAENVFEILGPAPATIEKLRGKYRWQILIKSKKTGALEKLVSSARPAICELLPSSVRLAIDVDPLNSI